MTLKEKALALLREQQCECRWEKDAQIVLTKLVESEGAFDLTGGGQDGVGRDRYIHL